jgi:uncharacterized protein (TIGR02117 family)
MRIFYKIFHWLIKGLIFLISLILLYLAIAIVLTIIPSKHIDQVESDITIYIRTNGVHTDFVLPTNRSEIDWFQYIKAGDFKQVVDPTYITFGWGDKGFYLETPEWSDLKASTAFKALFFLSSTAMHVSFLSSEPALDKDCKKLVVSEYQYSKLIEYIISSFKRNNAGEFILIPDKGYGDNDNFYEANGTYSFIKTCNTWLNNGLKQIGVKTAIWTPFDKCVFYHLK